MESPTSGTSGTSGSAGASSVLERFSPATRAWFTGAFAAPTPAQEAAWSAISSGEHTLVVAPTGSGKTLSAFLWALDRLHARAAGGPPGKPTGPRTDPRPEAPVTLAGISGAQAEGGITGDPVIAEVRAIINSGNTTAAEAALARLSPAQREALYRS